MAYVTVDIGRPLYPYGPHHVLPLQARFMTLFCPYLGVGAEKCHEALLGFSTYHIFPRQCMDNLQEIYIPHLPTGSLVPDGRISTFTHPLLTTRFRYFLSDAQDESVHAD